MPAATRRRTRSCCGSEPGPGAAGAGRRGRVRLVHREDLGGCARRVPFGPGGELDDRAGHLWWDDEPLVAHDDIRLRGAHNRANAAAAAAICLARNRTSGDT